MLFSKVILVEEFSFIAILILDYVDVPEEEERETKRIESSR